MARLRKAGDRFEAACAYCGQWREVRPRQLPCDAFFSHWEAEFTCCGQNQVATLTLEKDELDFH